MKALIIYQSIHHQNTEKIARLISEILGAKLVKPTEIQPAEILNYDLIGFGSGIYFWHHHVSLLNLVKNLPRLENKKAFIFSTSGAKYGKKFFHRSLRKLLIKKGFQIIDEFNCPGFDSFGPLKIFGGLNKGRPNENDLEKTRNFALKLLKSDPD